MSIQEKIKLDAITLTDFLPGYDRVNFVSTMSQEEAERLMDLADALREQGKEEEADKVDDSIPIEPTAALTQYVLLGRRGLLSMGLNLADAEKAYGADWLDRFDVGTGYLLFPEE